MTSNDINDVSHIREGTGSTTVTGPSPWIRSLLIGSKINQLSASIEAVATPL